MTKRIGFLTWGNGSQIRSFHDFNDYLDDLIYLPDLGQYDLSKYAALIAPDGMDSEVIGAQARPLNDYVRNGGLLVVFGGESTAKWVDVVNLEWLPIHAKDWLWWTKPGSRLEIHQPLPTHPICEAISLRDMSWHWIGAFAHNDSATSLLDLDDGRGSLLLDFADLPGGGRLIVSTLDPHVHNGERFMPATSRFLAAFYPWLNRELGIDRRRKGFKLTYLQSLHHETEWRPEHLADNLREVDGTTQFLPMYELTSEAIAGTDILYIPNNQDQIFLRKQQDVLLSFLAGGGHMIINSEPAIAWLPFLGTFQAVPPRPFTNIKVRVKNDPLGFFANMDEDFDGWCGIFGQYARGWTEPPRGAVWLTEVGPADAPRPADWLWKYPGDDGRGGYVFMHNGDNMIRYPDHGPAEAGLVRDICVGMLKERR